MVEFTAKYHLLTWTSLIAGSLVLIAAVAVRPLLQRMFGRRDLPFAFCVLSVFYVLVSALIHLSVPALVWTTIGLVVSGLAYHVYVAGTPEVAVPEANSSGTAWHVSAFCLVLVLAFNWFEQDFPIHYDYFHSLTRAIDLATNGQSPSTWMSTFDPTFWFVTEQGLLLVLDAIEMTVFGAVSSGVSQLFVFLVMWLIVRAVASEGVFHVVLALLLGTLLLDFNNAPRPHLLVGLWAGLICLRTAAGARWAELALYLLLLALSKRDGVVIALMLSLAFAARWLMIRVSIRIWLPVLGALAACSLVLLNSWVAIDSKTPLEAFVDAVTNIDWRQLWQIEQMKFLAAISVVAAVFVGTIRPRWQVVTVVSAMVAYVVLSTVILDGLDRYNFGTVERKIYYMLLPALLAAVMAACTLDREAAR